MKTYNLTNEERSKLFLALCVDVALAFSVFVFIPYEVYLANVVDFNFSLNKFWMPTALGFIFGIGSLLIHILLLRTKVFKWYTGLVMGIMVSGYIQSMFFNGMMKTLDGTVEEWDSTTKIINLIVWSMIGLGILVLPKILKNVWQDIYKFISILIIGMQGAALISLLFTIKIPSHDEVRITDKGLCEVAAEDNVIVFCLDKCDQRYVEQMLKRFPDALNNMGGFIYYPNATAKYSFTHIAVPYLLTGNMIPEYDPTNEQFCEQSEKSEYLNWILDNVGDVGIYTNEYCIRSDETREKIDNCVSIDYILRKKKTANACIKASMYRILPFALKNNFEYSANTFNQNIEGLNADSYNTDSHEMEARMLEQIRKSGLVVNEGYGASAFRFIHLKSTHPRYELYENGDWCEGVWTSIEQCLAGDFVLIQKYCDELERLNLFEDSTIIIVADHGDTKVLDSAEVIDRKVNPIFMYKPKGAGRDEVFTTSLAPVAQDDIFATVMNAYGQDGSKYGFSLEDIYEGMERKRYYYWSEQDPEVTDMDSCIHVEYEINGDSRDEKSWSPTGKRVYPNNSPRK